LFSMGGERGSREEKIDGDRGEGEWSSGEKVRRVGVVGERARWTPSTGP